MIPDLEAEFEARLARGEAVSLARPPGARGAARPAVLLIFGAGHFLGDLGDPRLNQRAALYGEAILEKPADKRPARQLKRFDGPEGGLELEFLFARVPGDA